MSPILRLAGESWLGVWARRVISIPAVCVLAILVIGGAPLWLFLSALVDLLKRTRWATTRAIVFFCLYLTCEVMGICAATALWIVPMRRTTYLRANVALQRRWTDALFFGAVAIFAMKVEVSGEALSGPFLLFARHASTADTVLAAALVANRQRLLLKYVLKRELLWDPCLDIVGRRLPNAFVERARDKTDADVAALVRLTEGLDAASAVLIYPEGTRFSASKLTRAIAKLSDPELVTIARTYRHVLPPKLAGPLALLAAAPQVDVVFLEHTGFEGGESFARFFSGELIGRTIHARFRRVRAAEIPNSGRALWLFTQWQQCDQFVARHLEQQG